MVTTSTIFAEAIDEKTKEQFNEAMEQDFVVECALMPDAHAGYTLPIGSVVATVGAIVPAYVGYDIGCGMCAIKTTYIKSEVEQNARKIFREIYNSVPVGKGKHETDNDNYFLGHVEGLSDLGKKMYKKRGASQQLGTLGGGNHFIEIGYDGKDNVWIIIHSGSRGFGHGLAGEYMKIASNSDKAKEGHYPLIEGTQEANNYISDLSIALEYALMNREKMIEAVADCMSLHIGGNLVRDSLINRNHNHAELKDGRWIHRKGATHAEDGMMGVIPANMRDGSFIVRGKGSKKSMCSSSHGAGRVMSRTQAKNSTTVEEMAIAMEGITARVDSGVLDESPVAYKNIYEVMELQKDLVEVVEHVKPIINIKG